MLLKAFQICSIFAYTLIENVLEGLYKMKLQGSDQFKTVLVLYNQELSRNGVSPSYQRLRTMVRGNMLIRRLGCATAKPGMKDLRHEWWSRVKKRENSQHRKERWENAVTGEQMDSVQFQSH